MSRIIQRALFLGVACACLVVLASPACAQRKGKDEGDGLDRRKMLLTAYSLRRRGNFRAAAAAYELILGKLTKDEKIAKRLLAKEAAELFVVMGKPEKAVLLYRRNNDVANEIKVLLTMTDAKRHQDAKRVAEFVNYPKGQALALAKLGKTQEALDLMKAKGLQREEADLLTEQGRYAEAAPIYEKLQDFFNQARCLRLAGKTRKSERAYEDAITQLRFSLRDENGNLKRVKTINKLYKQATDAILRERTRLALARAYGRLGSDYRKLAEAYALTGRDDYRQKAPKFADNAVKYLKKKKDLLEDRASEGDAYGAAVVKSEGLDVTIAEVEAEAKSYQ